LSIITNSAKTPSTKAPKGTVSVRLDSGSIKACFPRTHFADEKQLKLATGIPASNGWEATANKLQRRLQLELEEGKLKANDGSFNVERYREILEEYGLRAKLRVVKSIPTTADGQLPPKPELSILEVWSMYLEYIAPNLKETTFAVRYESTYTNFINDAVNQTKSEDAVKIRNWLIKNRNIKDVKFIISRLSEAYNLAIRRNLTTHNPYNGLADDIAVKSLKGKSQDEVEIETDDSVLDKSKAYTWEEVQIILEFIENTPTKKHLYKFIKFKFLTGVRTGEAIAFMWCDVMWDRECILIRRNYNYETKKFYHLKNATGVKELTRIFPMPRDGELWNLLKSIPQGEPKEVVFKSKNNKVINDASIRRIWKGGNDGTKGIITELIKQGKLTKYLPCYNTRHTFITHQIFDLGRDEKIVSAWCGHGEMVSQKHYQDITDRAMQINPETPANNQSSQKSEVDLLKEQVEQMRKMIEELQANK